MKESWRSFPFFSNSRQYLSSWPARYDRLRESPAGLVRRATWPWRLSSWAAQHVAGWLDRERRQPRGAHATPRRKMRPLCLACTLVAPAPPHSLSLLHMSRPSETKHPKARRRCWWRHGVASFRTKAAGAKLQQHAPAPDTWFGHPRNRDLDLPD